jgi:hypothetical protein
MLEFLTAGRGGADLSFNHACPEVPAPVVADSAVLLGPVWAGGDCVEVLNLVSGQYEHVPLGTHANKHGRVIGHNIAGSYATFPGTQRLTVKMTAERHTGRLLGAQIVGNEGSAMRIDTAATALWNRMTVEEMTALDLAYAPPFSPVWDPILVAARQASAAVRAAP